MLELALWSSCCAVLVWQEPHPRIGPFHKASEQNHPAGLTYFGAWAPGTQGCPPAQL